MFLKFFNHPNSACIALACIFYTSSASLYALDEVSKNDSIAKHKTLKQVEVSSHYSTRSPLPTQEISSGEIKNLNAGNVADVVRHFAGVSIKDYGGIGGLKTISVRGLGAAHTGVSYDGLMVGDIQNGQIDLSQFCLDNISAIALSNGQPTSLLQSARMFAFSSVLSLETKLPDYNERVNLSGRIGFKTGSFGLINPSFLFEKYFSPKFALTLYANGTKANGKYPYKININPYGQNWVTGDRINSDVTSLSSELNAIYHLSTNEKLEFKANQFYSERGVPGAVTYYNSYSTSRILEKTYLSQLRYENKHSSKVQYSLASKFSNQFMRYTDVNSSYYSLTGNKRIDKFEQNEYYFTSAIQYRPINNFTVAAALDAWYNNLFSCSNLSYLKDEKPTRQTFLANISAKYVVERFCLGGNLLYTGTHETADSANAAPDRHRFTPTAYISWQVMEDKNLVIRAFYKEIFRIPTFTELYFHNYGFKSLLPEKTHQYDIGLTYNTTEMPFLSYFSCSADGYYNLVNDKITTVYAMPYATVRNIGLVKIKGCDINLRGSKDISKNDCLQLNANYSFQLAQNFDNNPDTYADVIPYTPIHSGSASLTYSHKLLDLGYNMLFAGKRYSGQNSDINNYLEPYVDQSIFGRYTLKRFSIMAEVINFMNVNYAIVKYYPMPGRNYRININYHF